jgi:uncharacterized protein Yka (UPF0111/DUF47 family)
MNEIIELLTAFFQAAPALFSGIAILLAISAAVIVRHNSGAVKRIRASIDKLRDSFERSRKLLAEAERANYEVAEQLKQSAELNGDAVTEAEHAVAGIRDAKAGVEQALSIIRAIQDTDNSSSNSSLD